MVTVADVETRTEVGHGAGTPADGVTGLNEHGAQTRPSGECRSDEPVMATTDDDNVDGAVPWLSGSR